MNSIIVTLGQPGPNRKSVPPALTAPYLAALATPHVKNIKIYDLAVEPFDYQAPMPDIALITTTMAQSDHVFDIAKFLKGNGTKIIMGGPHVTLAYDLDPRIKEIADSVVLGEGEKALPQALEDYKNGKLQSTYYIPVDSLEGIPFSRLDLLDHTKYFTTTAIFGTRGCANKCKFCCVKDMYGRKYLKRPVDEVIEEIKFQTSQPNLTWLDRKLIEFWDDSPACDLDWFHELLEKMIPLKKWWLSQICFNVADNEETVKLMKASGCRGVLVGLESISKDVLKEQKKDIINLVDQYEQRSKILLKHGIFYLGALMFGFDQDTPESLFIDTLKVVEKMGMSCLQAFIVTPYPHSYHFKMLDEQDRLITKQEKYYNGYTVVHRPKNLHPADLQEGFIDFRKKFYSWHSVLKRMMKHKFWKYPEFLLWNAIFYQPNYQAIPYVDMKKWLKYLKTL